MTGATRKLILGFASTLALAAAGCASDNSGGLSFGAGSGVDGGGGGGSGDGSGGDTAGGGGSGDGSGDGTDTAGGGGSGGGSGGDGNSGGDVAGGGGSGSGDGDGDGDDPQTAEAQGMLERVTENEDAEPIVTAGNALLPGSDPLDQVAEDGDALANPAARVVVADDPLLGATEGDGGQLVGASVGSDSQAEGQLATLGVASDGELIVLEPGEEPLEAIQGAAGDIQSAAEDQGVIQTAIGATDLGGEDALIGVGALSPDQPEGTAATVGLESGGQTATLELGGEDATGALGDLTGGELTGDLTGGEQLLSGNAGEDLSLGGDPSLVGADIGADDTSSGSLLDADVASGGDTADVDLGGEDVVAVGPDGLSIGQ